jgi:hypothetical protein
MDRQAHHFFGATTQNRFMRHQLGLVSGSRYACLLVEDGNRLQFIWSATQYKRGDLLQFRLGSCFARGPPPGSRCRKDGAYGIMQRLPLVYFTRHGGTHSLVRFRFIAVSRVHLHGGWLTPTHRKRDANTGTLRYWDARQLNVLIRMERRARQTDPLSATQHLGHYYADAGTQTGPVWRAARRYAGTFST